MSYIFFDRQLKEKGKIYRNREIKK